MNEPGQWFGAVYINLGLTLILTGAWFTMTQNITSLSIPQQLWIWIAVGAVASLAFYRFSKKLWTSIIFHDEGLYIPWPNR